jgi:hypothetical protein
MTHLTEAFEHSGGRVVDLIVDIIEAVEMDGEVVGGRDGDGCECGKADLDEHDAMQLVI